MKQLLAFFLFFCPFLSTSQELTEADTSKVSLIEFKLKKTLNLEAETFIGADDFENLYYINNHILYKKTSERIYSYSNTQLGEISSVDIKNPLKILLFYRNFNTALLLDSKLNELTKPFNFNLEPFSINVAFASFSSNDNIWLYSYDDNILYLWNYQSKNTIYKSQPLTSYFSNVPDYTPAQLISSYKKCWLIGKDQSSILIFDENGIFQEQVKHFNVEFLMPAKRGQILLRNNSLSFFNGEEEFDLTLDKETVIKSFYANKKLIYIFDGRTIFVYEYLKK